MIEYGYIGVGIFDFSTGILRQWFLYVPKGWFA